MHTGCLLGLILDDRSVKQPLAYFRVTLTAKSHTQTQTEAQPSSYENTDKVVVVFTPLAIVGAVKAGVYPRAIFAAC